VSQQVNWQDFDKLILIRKLRDLVGEWWKVQMHFTDNKGLLRGVPSGKFFNPLNPISQAIVESDRGFSLTMKDVEKTTLEASLSKKPKVVRNASGFSALFVPLRVKGQSLGCVFADGFILEQSAGDQKNQIRSFLTKVFGIKAEDLFGHIKDLPQLSEKDLHYLCELIKIVASEMLNTQANLSKVKKTVAILTQELENRYHFSKMIGKSSKMQKLYSMVEKVCDSEATVLIRGENGTGKELVSRALHYNSCRKKAKLLVVNCGAFNDNLLESELFGHVKGSFTGANKNKKGVFEAANGGTLFLDEIGDTSMQMQVKLLRVLQEGTFTPVGSTEIKHTNVRVVAATNRNLEEMIQNNQFRQDLYYRLNVILLEIPPLRERTEDIPMLVEHFLKKHKHKTSAQQLSQSCLEKLLDYNWPGNVRELENEMERLCVLSDNAKPIEPSLLSTRIRDFQSQSNTIKLTSTKKKSNFTTHFQKAEKQLLLTGLQETQWNTSRLAKYLAIDHKQLLNKITKYGLDKRKAS